MGTSFIVGMAVAAVASAVTEKILLAAQKPDAAGYLDLTTKSGLAITALTVFTKFIKVLITLG